MRQRVPVSRDDLRRFSAEKLLALFRTLESPDIEEMHGEYQATLLRQPSQLAGLSGALVLANPVMPWQCKAFRPVSEDGGRGYNTFRLLGRIVQRFPMQTLVAPSRYDGKPAYQLVYRAYHSLCGSMHMVDEVRRVTAGLYLGIGTWGFTVAQRQVALPFMLAGPVAPYREDLGAVREGFVLRQEVPALEK